MEKTSLKLGQVYNLQQELTGYTDPNTGNLVQPGLLHEKLGLVTKYWLTDLVSSIEKHTKNVDDLRKEMIQKYGEEIEIEGKKDFQLKQYIPNPKKGSKSDAVSEVENVLNPKFKEFSEDMSKLMDTDIELEHHKFVLEDLKSIESNSNFPVFFKLISIN